jgi:hypothetical protein
MIEQCGVVWYSWAKDMAAKDIHKEMLPMYGEHCLSLQTFPLVWPSKTNLSGKAILTMTRLKKAVCACFRLQPQEFYAASFQGLVKRWDNFLNFV